MNLKRHSVAVGLVATGALMLSACGSDDNTGGSSNGPSSGASNAACEGKAALKASGSTAQANAMARFSTKYSAECDGKSIDYNASGSGAGIKDFLAKQADFAGSDSPLNKEKGEVEQAQKRCDSPAWNLPMVFGPIAVTYNLDGVDGLTLDATTLAKIFSGQIKTWNDPAIAKLNNGKKLPSDKITVIFRNDESGTTDNFQKYLKSASKGAWTKGVGKSFAGGIGEGARGNDGTSTALKNTKGGITYNEWSFAQQNKLSYAKIVNSGGGEGVELNADSAAKAVAAAKTKGTGNDLELNLDSIYGTKEAGAYPLMLATYEIVCSKYADADTGKAVKSFLSVAAQGGQDGLDTNGYVKLPNEFQGKLLTAIKAIG